LPPGVTKKGAEAKLGELIEKLPKPKPIIKGSPDGSLRGTVRVLPKGITKKISHKAQTIKRILTPGTAKYSTCGWRVIPKRRSRKGSNAREQQLKRF